MDKARTKPTQKEKASSKPVEKLPWRDSQWAALIAAAVIAAIVFAAYSNSFGGPFIYDDLSSIPNNPTIYRLNDIGKVLSPPASGETVGGRPVLNLSYAINYAISGASVRGYHVTNLAIHTLAALALFGILRRTLLLPKIRRRWGGSATPPAFAAALLWAVHPLQTESVTYIVQRAESLMGLFYLLSLYCAIRGAESTADGAPVTSGHTARKLIIPWYAASVLFCLIGMATKEVMVTAPLVILLYDRAFLSGSFRGAIRVRWGLYLGLAATWILLAYLVISTYLVQQSNDAGAVDIWTYACSQPGVILHYLRLSFWPEPLCFEYDWPVAGMDRFAVEILPGLLVLGVLGAATIRGLWLNRAWGFVGACFFLMLAPTSSVLPLRQLAFEHRMYLPLAAVVVFAASTVAFVGERMSRRVRMGQPLMGLSIACAACFAASALAICTYNRNSAYSTTLSIWKDTLDKVPNSCVVLADYAYALNDAGNTDEAISQYRKALKINPRYPNANDGLGVILFRMGQVDEAIVHFQAALDAEPKMAETRYNLGYAWQIKKNFSAAIDQYGAALEIKPDLYAAHNRLGEVYLSQGKTAKAVEYLRRALEIEPDFADAHCNMGNALSEQGQTGKAAAEYQKALGLNPKLVTAEANLGCILMREGNFDGAIVHLRKALAMEPNYPLALTNLGTALWQKGKLAEAIAQYEEAVKIAPNFPDAHYNLGRALYSQGRIEPALAHWRTVLKLRPDSVATLILMARVLSTYPDASLRNGKEAVELAQRAAKLSGGRDPAVLDAQASAFAEDGRFPEAVEAADRALEAASAQGNSALAGVIRQRIALYRENRPYRQTPEDLKRPIP
jgi:protein O-mannosyl-transferase